MSEMMNELVEKYKWTYFAQEKPDVPIVGLIADMDLSEPYELDAAAVFKSKPGYLVVHVSGCSCWPDRGQTSQVHCLRRTDVQRELSNQQHFGYFGYGGNNGLALFMKCQERGWKIQDQ